MGSNVIFKKGELFSGPGGLTLGARLAKVVDKSGKVYRIEHEWAYDNDANAVKTYRHNFCKVEDEKSLNSVRIKDVREMLIEETEEIDCFCFGFPCNDFSIVGEKKGFEGTYGPLYTYGVKIINKHNPKWFLAENVGGLQSSNEGYAFQKILADLQTAGDFGGYVLTPHLYKFEQYGVPQARHRIIIVGIRKDLDDDGIKFRVPAPLTTDPAKYVTSRQALERPYKSEILNNEMTNHPKSTIDRLRHIPPGKNAWYEGIPAEHRLNVKGAKLSNIYKRLDPSKPAYTVTGSGGGGTHMYHYDELRALTNRERARLQTFPDDFEFIGPKEAVRKQIGMAVPPMGAKLIFEAILKSFASIEYDYVDPYFEVKRD